MTSSPDPQVRVRRGHKYARYEREVIEAVLDAGRLCHLGYIHAGAPVVTPTFYWRDGDHIYVHASSASRLVKDAGAGLQVCVTVTHLDGWVLARSAFHHAANYRSVMIMGVAEPVVGDAARMAALRVFMEGLFPGRWDHLRPVLPKELKATSLLRVSLARASAKIRNGPPQDDPGDEAWPVWAGVIPLALEAAAPVADAHTPAGAAPPAYALADEPEA